MKRRVRMLAAVCCGVVVSGSCVFAADVDYAKAVAEAQKANDVAAINRLCNQWAAAAPGDERPRLILGRTLAKAGMTDRALEQFELAAEANPLSPVVRCELGELFLAGGSLEQASREFTEALRLQRTFVPAMLGEARVALRGGDANAALAAARKVQAAAAGNADARTLVGDCLLALGKQAEALAELQKAVELAPDSPDALFGLAKAYQLNGQEPQAQEYWARFLTAEPGGDRAERVRNGWVVLRRERLPASCRFCPVWSPDGRRLLFGYGKLRLIELASGKVTDVRVPGDQKLFSHDWSADGRYVAGFGKQAQARPVLLYELGPDGVLTATAKPLSAQAVAVTFSPDGSQLMLGQVTSPADGVRGRFLGNAMALDLSTGELAAIPWRHASRRYQSDPACSPDGKTVVLRAWGGDMADRAIFAVRRDGSAGPTQLTDNGVVNTHPFISPDGRSVAFQTQGEGRTPGVELVRIHGGHPPARFADGKAPYWAPDGRKLAHDSFSGIVVAYLGGLDAGPLGLAAKRTGEALSVVVTSRSEDVQHVSLRWEAFDDNSFRIDPVCESEEATELPPGGKLEWTLEMSPEQLADICTVKARALNQDGIGAVELVDWVQGGE